MKACILLLAGCTLGASGQTGPQLGVVVQFKPSVPSSDDLWMVRSYDQQFTFHPEKISEVTIKGSSPHILAIARKRFADGLLGLPSNQHDKIGLEPALVEPNLIRYKVIADKSLDFSTREKLAHSLPKGASLSWEIEPAYAFIYPKSADASSLSRLF